MYERPEILITTLGRGHLSAPARPVTVRRPRPALTPRLTAALTALARGTEELVSGRLWRRWRLTSQTQAALGGLEDHILKDIGLARSEIPYIARAKAMEAEERRAAASPSGYRPWHPQAAPCGEA